eukprot:TRINITY_DN81727_c0_g1_i1.p1 TRINITY_DN81727_c0_g1~~TRINITY_DN81727_c0_g1_i1.p1  ORF type:complete len:406 (+),score=83.44 TRINITY_DN81727_c0_g1_i1:43-1260(+)
MVTWSKGRLSADLVTIVAGNEASDADSIIAAVTYGYLKHALRGKEKGKHGRPRVFVPIVKCLRKHMMLRQETLAILDHAGVDYHDLLHMDDKAFRPLMNLVDTEDPSFHVILVDHNKADGLLKGKVKGRVVEILDHHKDLEAYEAKKEVIRFDGDNGVPMDMSACTVIGAEFLKSKTGRKLLEADDGAVAAALVSVIIIDSKGLSQASAHDLHVAKQLKTNIPDVGSKKHLQFKWLINKRENHHFWSSATLEENLLYDFKQFESEGFTCGISSTFLSLDDLALKLKDPEQAAALDEYVKDPLHADADGEVQSSVYIIMLKRDPMHLAVVTKVPGLREFSQNFLASSDVESLRILKLKTIRDASKSPLHTNDQVVDAYVQKNNKASRKQVGPTCQSLLAAFASAGH